MNAEISRDPLLCYPNMELKMSKKVLLDGYLTNVKKLLSTGILEGARVKYVSNSPEDTQQFQLGFGEFLTLGFDEFLTLCSAYVGLVLRLV